MTRNLQPLLLCSIIFLITQAAAAAEKHALLVGVSEYPNLPELRLKGPGNDVALIREVLQAKGFSAAKIRILADGVPGAKLPTRQAILAELAQLATRTSRGDVVYLHFSGHGSRQPGQTEGNDDWEADGLDEIFLPRDADRWSDTEKAVKNAITDDEMHDALLAIRKRGAFVWVVFDSCHSATMTRIEGVPELRLRGVAPVDLGIPPELLKRSRPSASSRPEAADPLAWAEPSQENGAGKYVAFFAAQSTELTPELLMPRSGREQRVYGLLTYAVVQVLAAGTPASYRQIGQRILQHYAAWGFLHPTPLFVGNHLDAPVWGQRAEAPVSQWRLQSGGDGFTIPAGQLHQLTEGDVFAVLPSATAALSQSRGTLKISHAGIFESRLLPVGDAKGRLDRNRLPDQAFARLVGSRPRLKLRVAPPPADAVTAALCDKVSTALRGIAESRPASLLLEIADTPAAPADLRLAVADDRLWLLPPSGELIQAGPDKRPSLGLDLQADELQRTLSTNLTRIAKVTNLLRLANLMDVQLSDRPPIEVDVRRRCAGSQEEEVLLPGTVPTLVEGDTMRYRIANTSRRPVDLTLLLVDGEYGIIPLFPRGMQINRVEAGGSVTEEFEVTVDTVGRERLILIAVKAEPNQLMSDFRFLAQSGLEIRIEEGLTVEQGDLLGLFIHAGFGEDRGVVRHRSLATASMHVFSWRTRKR